MKDRILHVLRRLGRSLFERKYLPISLAAAPVALFVMTAQEPSTSAQQQQLTQLSSVAAQPSLVTAGQSHQAPRVQNVAEPPRAEPPAVIMPPKPGLESETTSKLQASRLLERADESASVFAIRGPNTRSVVSLFGFFDATGWNECIDGVVMKSCPEGYEFFCQSRDMLFRMYEGAGGDIDPIINLFRAMDFRDAFYQVATLADDYQSSTDRVSTDRNRAY